MRISRDRGDRASPLHLGERNYTSTGPKLSKTSSVHVPHPWRMHHFEGTDRSFHLYTALPCALNRRNTVDYYGAPCGDVMWLLPCRSAPSQPSRRSRESAVGTPQLE